MHPYFLDRSHVCDPRVSGRKLFNGRISVAVTSPRALKGRLLLSILKLLHNPCLLLNLQMVGTSEVSGDENLTSDRLVSAEESLRYCVLIML